MRNFSLFLLLLCLTILPAAQAKEPVASSARSKGSSTSPARVKDSTRAWGQQKLPAWLLHQDTVIGKMDIYITPNAVRAIDLSRNCIFVSRAPDWKVTTYRDDEKLQMQESLQQWYDNGNKVFYNKGYARGNADKGIWESFRYDGIDCQRYFEPAAHVVKPHASIDAVKVDSFKVLGVEYVSTNQIPAAPEISKFMQGLYCSAHVRDVPLVNRSIVENAPAKPRFVTTAITRVQVDPTFFDTPNYQIADERKILFGKAMNEDIADIIGGLRIGDDLGDSANKPKRN